MEDFLKLAEKRYSVKKFEPEPLSDEMRQAVYDSKNRVNLNGPYDTAEAAVNAMLED